MAFTDVDATVQSIQLDGGQTRMYYVTVLEGDQSTILDLDMERIVEVVQGRYVPPGMNREMREALGLLLHTIPDGKIEVSVHHNYPGHGDVLIVRVNDGVWEFVNHVIQVVFRDLARI